MTYQPEVNDHHSEIIKAVRQSIQMRRWQEAYALAEQEHLFEDLSLWGEYNQLVDLCQWFLPQPGWQPQPKQAITIYLYLGRAYTILGNEQQALEFHQQALRISRQIGFRKSESMALSFIGSIHFTLGNRQQALESLQQALRISRQIGYRLGEGMALSFIGGIDAAQGNRQQALESLQQALRIFQELGDQRGEELRFRHGESTTLNTIGSVYNVQGNQQQALELHQQALRISREIGYRQGEGMALIYLGTIYVDQGKPQQALEFFQQALRIFRETGFRRGENIALSCIGGIDAAQGKPQQALEFFQQALRISQELNVHSALDKKPPLQASRTSILVVRRVIGPMEPRLWGSGPGSTLSWILKAEPAIQINLDGKWIGTIRQPKRSLDWFSAMHEEAVRRVQAAPSEEEWSQFEIQAGHHDLTLDVTWSSAIYYMAFTVAPAIQSFDIAPGETVMFLCQYTPATRGHMIRLEKIG